MLSYILKQWKQIIALLRIQKKIMQTEVIEIPGVFKKGKINNCTD